MGIVRLRQRQIRRTKGVTSWFVRRHDRREQVGEPSRFPRIDNAGEHGRGAPATGRQRVRRLTRSQTAGNARSTIDGANELNSPTTGAGSIAPNGAARPAKYPRQKPRSPACSNSARASAAKYVMAWIGS